MSTRGELAPFDPPPENNLTDKFNKLIEALQEYAVQRNDRQLDKILNSAGFERKTPPNWPGPGNINRA